ncbi:MAG: NAD(P)H-hydrate dehydratase [Candidatus Wildermuthbacteria bacterium]|nr:NAD(P)H-hydrate dehydratase [Candidatus Wildermuthbacteria bacterium]
MQTVTKDILKTLYPARPAEVRKYDFGLVLVIGGGEFYTGAPGLAALAAFRTGADMVRVVAPKRAADVIASFSPIIAAYPLDNSHLLAEHLSTLLTMTEAAKTSSHSKVALVIGGGIGRSEETLQTVLEYLSQIDIPAVIDADAIYAVAKNPEAIAGKPFVITPNTYELQLLGGQDIRPMESEARIQEVQNLASKLQTTLVAKAKVDIISNGTDVLLNETGSPYMSGGGLGDTLSGIAGALLARGIDTMWAGAGAAYINGKAGELAAKRMGESLVATDIIDSIPEAIRL